MERFVAQEHAIKIAQDNDERWRLNANEWRAAMTDRERDFLPRNLGYVIALMSFIALIVQFIGK